MCGLRAGASGAGPGRGGARRGGQVGLPSQDGTSGCPPWPLPLPVPRPPHPTHIGQGSPPLLLPKQPTPISSHVTEVGATDFLGKRAFQNLICNLFYQAAYFISRPGHMAKHLCKVEGGCLEFASPTPRLMDTCRAGVTGCDLLSHDFMCISMGCDWTCRGP